MTKRHYFTSLLILLIAIYVVKTIFQLHWPEALIVVLLAIVCVVHTNDMMDDIRSKKLERRRKDGGSDGTSQGIHSE